MATPKKRAKEFSDDAEDENPDAHKASSKYDDDDDDFDNMPLDEYENYDSAADYDDDDD